MKKIGGKKFNRSTWQWEYEPIRYVEFHCTPKEWGDTGNSKYLLVRDFIRGINLNELAWQDVTVKDVIDLAVNDIICNRYNISIKEKEEQIYGGKQTVWEIDVNGAPYYTYVCGICDIYGDRWAPELYETIGVNRGDDKLLIAAVAGVCNAIFYLIHSVESGKYYEKYISGEYKVSVGLPRLDRIKL